MEKEKIAFTVDGQSYVVTARNDPILYKYSLEHHLKHEKAKMGEKITINICFRDGEVKQIKISETELILPKLFEMNLQMITRYLYGGNRLNASDTPLSLHMENGDYVDAI